MIRLAKQIVISNFAELKLPYKLTYAFTYRCQLRCVMCNIWKKKDTAELAKDEIKEIFARSPVFSWINMSGGEIFLREDFAEIIDIITAACKDLYLLNFPTNGFETELIVENVQRIVRSPRFARLMVTVSLDGPPELHDRIRNRDGSWERAVETYERLRKMRSRFFDVYFGMTLQDRNADAFDAMLKAVRERIPGIARGDFHVNLLHLSDHYYANADRGGIRDRERILRSFREVRSGRRKGLPHPVSFLEDRYKELAGTFLTTGRTPVPCQAMNASVFIDPAGTVYPCTIYDRPLGNIRETGYDLGQLWNSERRLTIRKEVKNGSCPQCWTPCEAYQSILAGLLPMRRR